MADLKISELTNLTAADPANDMIPIVDVSATPPASGSTKRISINNILACSPTATLASATISGNLTLSAGTANGVGYLNASKVLTAGSALIFDGTNLGIGGTGQLRFATSGGAIGDNYIGTENSFSMKLHCGRGSTSSIEIASDKLLFYTSASERYRIASDGVATWSNVGGVAGTAMTLNSTGLGVGVTPSAIANVIRLEIGGALSTNLTLRSTSANASARNWMVGSNVNAFGDFVIRQGNSQGAEPNSGTDRLVLDASGNLLVGTTSGTFRGTFVVAGGANRDILAAGVTAVSDGFQVKWNHATTKINVIISNMPTSSAGLAAGTLWNDAGTIKIA